MEVEINVKTIYHQAPDHRDDRGRKGQDPRRGRNIPSTIFSMSFAIDIRQYLCISKVGWDLHFNTFLGLHFYVCGCFPLASNFMVNCVDTIAWNISIIVN